MSNPSQFCVHTLLLACVTLSELAALGIWGVLWHALQCCHDAMRAVPEFSYVSEDPHACLPEAAEIELQQYRVLERLLNAGCV